MVKVMKDSRKDFDSHLYVKIVLGLLCFSLFSVIVCFCSLTYGLASEMEDESETAPAPVVESELEPETGMELETMQETAPVELETEPEMESETEPETLYTDGTLTLLPDGTIIEGTLGQEDETIEFESSVSDTGNSEQAGMDTGEIDATVEETLSGAPDDADVPETQISDSPLYISADAVYIQPVSGDEPDGIMAVASGGDVISLPADNVISYKVRFDGNDYTAVFPVSVADSLSVSDGVLCNVGASAVTGRLFADSFDTGSYGDRFVTLNSVLSTSGNNNAYRYGSWSYVTRYYPYSGSGSSSLNSSVSYGNVYVVEEPPAFSSMTTFQLIFVGCLCVIIVILLHYRSKRRFS